jgi:hypothetical protein
MNKGKDGRHYIEVKRFGTYSIVEDHVINAVDSSNNLSEKTLPERPPRAEKVKPEKSERR